MAAAVPAALAAFRETFVEIMERVQQGGIEQMEHVKRPYLFTGSWMEGVATHQHLLGRVLRTVPGPEVCLRVFNLLRPPAVLPPLLGDRAGTRG
jgi:hypothetical protein